MNNRENEQANDDCWSHGVSREGVRNLTRRSHAANDVDAAAEASLSDAHGNTLPSRQYTCVITIH